MEDGHQAIVGCVPLAVGTIMGYYQWPVSAQGYSYDWDTMLSNANDIQWARLFEVLGRFENINVSYGKGYDDSYSTAWCPNLIRTFKNYGYSEPVRRKMDLEILKEVLTSKMPVIIDGPATGNDAYRHCFIIDGGYTLKVPTIYKITYKEYLHCVWGGSGSNGFFLFSNGELKDDSGWQIDDIYYGYTPNK